MRGKKCGEMRVIMTRFEKIKNFTLTEMAAFLSEHTGCSCCDQRDLEFCGDVSCFHHIEKWLESEGEIDGIL